MKPPNLLGRHKDCSLVDHTTWQSGVTRWGMRMHKMEDQRRAYGTPLLVWIGTKTYLWEEIFGGDNQDREVNPLGNGLELLHKSNQHTTTGSFRNNK